MAFCLFPSLSLYSQHSLYEYNTSGDLDYFSMRFTPTHESSPKKVKKISYEVIDPCHDKTEKYLKYFDSFGNLSYFCHLNEKNDTVEKGVFSFVDKDKMLQSDYYRKSKLKRSKTSVYDADKKLISIVIKDGKNRIKSLSKWSYTDKNKISESALYKKDTSAIKYKWTYEYNEDGSTKKSTLFYGNGKVKKVWSYQCNPEGEKEQVKEKEIKVCKNTYTDDQFYYTTWRSTDPKGKVIKSVNKYTSKDHFLIESCVYNESERLIYKSTYDKSGDKLLTSAAFDKKGKKSYEFAYTYENGNQVSYSYSRGEKIKYRSTMKFNSEGLMSEQLDFDSKGRLIKTTKLTYEL